MQAHDVFVKESDPSATPIFIVAPSDYASWLSGRTAREQAWLETSGFNNKVGVHALLSNESGRLSGVLHIIDAPIDPWSVGELARVLPEGNYRFEADALDITTQSLLSVMWGLGAYQFNFYKASSRHPARLVLSETLDADDIFRQVRAIFRVRDLINTTTEDLNPDDLATVVVDVVSQYGADATVHVGDALLSENYPAIHAVGRASACAPRLLDVRWGDPTHPKVTLVGKGVCYDSGGLTLKPSASMLLMKKDMAGAAHALALGEMLMSAQLPIRLRLLLPLVENAIGANAYRPGDVIATRKGLTIEVKNTDAEGRLILADALTEACTEKPDMLIDIATLTGGSAVGTGMAALFANADGLAEDILRHAASQHDPAWRLPIYAPYRKGFDSAIADISNVGARGQGGTIGAAVFLNAFVDQDVQWAHFDIVAWNRHTSPGRPEGGDALMLRALYDFFKTKYQAGKTA